MTPWRFDRVVVHHAEALQHRPNVRLLRQVYLPCLSVAQDVEAEEPLYHAEFLEVKPCRKAVPHTFDDLLALRCNQEVANVKNDESAGLLVSK
jgi:hypothetical protein